MNIIAVDDERRALNTLEKAIHAVSGGATVTGLTSAKDALRYARENTVDVAFLDIKMDEMSGLFLAKHLKDIRGDTNIIFVTGHSQYGANAFELRASGYVMKPIDPARVALELENLRNPVAPQDNGVRVQCFGNFEVFAGGVPVSFKRSKSKEAFAYLVDRKGAGASKKEIAAILLGNDPYTRSVQSYIHIILTEMMRALGDAGHGGVVTKKHNLYAVDVSKFDCDYYRYEQGDIWAVNRYHGEYMTNYDWAEFTAAHLASKNPEKS